ncbi:hypothetical protein T07_2240 [Trichinella nelsoni]|uniref:Uncharacterized protein n=1 Tax=Trichinella nelsoni TaxID=6336 RepID=A0A0V0S4J6_9BILA|nr:hypothetical protein T07_2240 [Trichinella nelsoni]
MFEQGALPPVGAPNARGVRGTVLQLVKSNRNSLGLNLKIVWNTLLRLKTRMILSPYFLIIFIETIRKALRLSIFLPTSIKCIFHVRTGSTSTGWSTKCKGCQVQGNVIHSFFALLEIHTLEIILSYYGCDIAIL